MPFIITNSSNYKESYTESDEYIQDQATNPDRYIELYEYDEGRARFYRGFKPSGIRSVDWGKEFYFKYPELDALIRKKTVEEGIEENKILVAFYHGLDEIRSDTFCEIYGLRLLTVTDQTSNVKQFTPDIENDFNGKYPNYELKGAGIDEARRRDWRTDYWDDYEKSMRVNRLAESTDSKPISYPDHDPKAIIFPWESEIKEMYKKNEDFYTSADDFRFVLTAFADYYDRQDDPNEDVFKGENGLRHSVCLHTQRLENGRWRDNLENGAIVSFIKRGLEYGNMCPPRCKSYIAR